MDELAVLKTDVAEEERTLEFTKHLLKRAISYDKRQENRFLWYRTTQTPVDQLMDVTTYSGRYCVDPKTFLANEYVNIARQVHDEGENLVMGEFCLPCRRVRGYSLDRDLDRLGLDDIQSNEMCGECKRFVFRPDEFHQTLIEKILEQYVLLERVPDQSELVEQQEDEQILKSIPGTACQQELIRRRWREQLTGVYAGALSALDLNLQIGALEKRLQRKKAALARAADL